MKKYFDVEYVYQKLDKIPEDFSVPKCRTKPWGTGHAILCAKDVIIGPFAVINADDCYGVNAFKAIYDFLKIIKTMMNNAIIVKGDKNV